MSSAARSQLRPDRPQISAAPCARSPLPPRQSNAPPRPARAGLRRPATFGSRLPAQPTASRATTSGTAIAEALQRHRTAECRVRHALPAALRIALISEHASPLATLGGTDAGGQNVYVMEVARALAARGHRVDVLTRRDDPRLAAAVELLPGVRVLHIDAGAVPVPKEALLPHMEAFGKRGRSAVPPRTALRRRARELLHVGTRRPEAEGRGCGCRWW
ncbi:MAG: glycosyltransferase [Rubrivivax sp.]